MKINNLFADAKLLKIDTDGFDIKIINGSWEFINKTKPVIFFEYDYDLFSRNHDDGIALFKKFYENEYRNALIYDNFGRLLLHIETNDIETIQHLTNYIKDKKHSAIPYYDIIAYHIFDHEILNEFLENEITFQNSI